MTTSPPPTTRVDDAALAGFADWAEHALQDGYLAVAPRDLASVARELLAARAALATIRESRHLEYCMDLGHNPDGPGYLACPEWNAHPANASAPPTSLCTPCAARTALAAYDHGETP